MRGSAGGLFYTCKAKIKEHDISAYQSYPFVLHRCVVVMADPSCEWQPNSRQPPPGKCFSASSGCVWGGYTRSEHWLAGSRRPLYELCSLCQWLLLECNSFVSRGWSAGQSSKVESLRLGPGRWRGAFSTAGQGCGRRKKKKQHLVRWHSEIPPTRRFYDPFPRLQLFFIQYSRRSKSERSEKTTHGGHIVCVFFFFDKHWRKER